MIIHIKNYLYFYFFYLSLIKSSLKSQLNLKVLFKTKVSVKSFQTSPITRVYVVNLVVKLGNRCYRVNLLITDAAMYL